MKIPQVNYPLPVHDYSSAIEGAVSWLGVRHLLAVPVTARHPRHPVATVRMQKTPWFQTTTGGS